jgi:hypothetical protein
MRRVRVRVSPPSCREPSGLLPTRRWSPRTSLTLTVRLEPTARLGTRRHPRRPCHKRAIHSSPERSPADNHGQPRSSIELRDSTPSQVMIAADLALGAGGRRPIGLLIVATVAEAQRDGGGIVATPMRSSVHEPTAIAAPLPALVLPAHGARDAGRCAARGSSRPLPARVGGPMRRAL